MSGKRWRIKRLKSSAIPHLPQFFNQRDSFPERQRRDFVAEEKKTVLEDVRCRAKRILFLRAFLLPSALLLATFLFCIQGYSLSDPEISNWATVEGHSNGVPIYAFGYTYIYGVSPDFLTDVILQEDNQLPTRKIQPKKSWEIKSNLFGSTPAREPRTAANDDQPDPA
jgi:hypothetical protein